MDEEDDVHRKKVEEEEDEDEGLPGRVLFAIGTSGSLSVCVLGSDGEGAEEHVDNDDLDLSDHVDELPENLGFYVWEGKIYPGSCVDWEGVWRPASRDDFEDMAPTLVTPLYVPVRRVLRSA